jgi:hypothetical protein
MPIQVSMAFFTLWKYHSEINMEAQQNQNSQSNLNQNEQCWRFLQTRPQMIMYSYLNKSWCWQEKKTRHEDHWSRRLRNKSYRHLIFNKETKSYVEEKTHCWELQLWAHKGETRHLDAYLSTCTKMITMDQRP